MLFNFSILEEVKNPIYIALRNDASQAHSIDIGHGYHDLRGVRQDTELVELGLHCGLRAAENVLNDSDPMIGIHDFIPDLKGHLHLAFL
jgi:hypothetical protein